MKKTKLKLYLLLTIIVICIIAIPIAYARYSQKITKKVTLNVRMPNYTVKFNSNRNDGNVDDISSQNFVYGTKQKLNINTFVNGDKNFYVWNTERDGSGTSYINEQEVDKLSSVDGAEIILYAQWTNAIAEVNGTFYYSLQNAINAVPKNNTQTTVNLLKNTSENITIAANQNILCNMQNHTLSVPRTKAAITNNGGTVELLNGIILSSATTDGVINNSNGGEIIINNTRVEMLSAGGKQALYNDEGTVIIKGNSYLSSESIASVAGNKVRAAVQNQSLGTLIILEGTIVSKGYHGITNAGTMIIGTKDNNINKNSPIIQGQTYGIYATSNFKFYDGIAKGITKGINDETKIDDTEIGFQVANSEEVIDGTTYRTAYLAQTNTVTFNPNGGVVSEESRGIEYGDPVGALPIPERPGYEFTGWFTSEEEGEGEEITSSTIITGDVTFYAHWIEHHVAEVNGVIYSTLQAAIDTAPTNNTETTIKLLENTSEAVTVARNQNIVFNLQTYTLSNVGDSQVIVNNGRIKIENGTITSNGANATIDNSSTGRLIISGGNIIATGTRSAIWNEGGTLEISGNPYISSSATGTPTVGVLKRGTIHNLRSGTVTITGGTIVGNVQQAISNAGTLKVGINGDGNINVSNPVIIGETYGIVNTGTFKFYDGIIKGITDAISGSITEQELNSQIVDDTEIIDGKTYKVEYLE